MKITDKYTYNEANDTYVIPVKHRTKSLVIKGYRLRAIRRALTSLLAPASTVKEVAARFKLMEEDIEAIKKSMGITRDSHPLTEEELENGEPVDLAKSLLQEKEAAVSGLVEKYEWKNIQDDATRWRQFKEGTLDVYKLVLEDWTPPKQQARIAPQKLSLIHI